MKDRSALGSKPSLNDSGKADPEGSLFLRHASPAVTAVLVDAGFFLVRSRRIFGKQGPEETARTLHGLALDHLNAPRNGPRVSRLYRIFVYDAHPSSWKGHTPLGKSPVDYGRSEVAVWRRAFHDALRSQRKVALRLGELPTSHVHWRLKQKALHALCQGARDWTDITDADFHLDLRQKGVDMRLGIDIAALSFKQQVNQIILVSGDSDFVPAAKLARREGIDFILDPMWATIRPDLHEHIDGLRSVCPRPTAATP
ncbi:MULTISPECIES: NYN domain-containing protein [unclassified Thioalkalivibrio]|uniref:NYN domain-containing protein n=1 Tax=unclassified Thioalkalivibrio TaxID=2621013 RepID=UPI000362A40C|nr:MULTISPECIES: NYN domain-containing protein [unclassified Thioalkalivibrio]